MSAEIHGPKCSSANVILSKKCEAYVCEDCHYVLPEAPVSPLRIFLSYGHEANRADLRDYLRQKLAPQLHDRPDADRLVKQILEKSEGVFLYVERFCDDVQQNHLSLDRPEQFPQGLGGIFCQWFQRQFPDLERFRQDVRPALRAILAACEPLPVEILQRLFNWQDEELRDFTRTLGTLFPVTKEANCEVIKPYHKSFADWLADEAKAGVYFVSVMEGHRTIAAMCWNEYLQGMQSMCAYALRHLAAHLVTVGRAADAKTFLASRIEATDPKHHSFFRLSSLHVELKNELQVVLNMMGVQKRWHPKPAESYQTLGPQEDYCEFYRFPCCGLSVVGDYPAPSQLRADGCEDAPV